MTKRPLTILIAEDHDSTRKGLAKMLTRRGYAVQEAKNGQEALADLTGCKFDLLICDIGLPDMSGWQLLGTFREHCPEIPAIAVTGFGRPEEVEASEKAGFHAHLTKPVSMAQVEAAMEKAMSRGSHP